MDLMDAVKQLPAHQRPGAMAVLFALEHGGESSVTDLGLVTRLSRQQLRTIIHKLEPVGILTRNQPETNQNSTKISLTATRTSRKDQPQTNHKSTKKQPPYHPSEEAKKAAATWDEKRMLPKSDWTDYWKIFDEMHRIDKLQWNGPSGIWAIVEHATTVWETTHIQSPTKLRQKSRPYPELYTWEVIRNQIQAAESPDGAYKPRRPSLSQ